MKLKLKLEMFYLTCTARKPPSSRPPVTPGGHGIVSLLLHLCCVQLMRYHDSFTPAVPVTVTVIVTMHCQWG